MTKLAPFFCMATMLTVTTLARAWTSIPQSKISKLVAFTDANSNSDQLIVYLDTAPACGTSTGYSLSTVNARNQTAAALLNAAFLNDRGVSLEVDSNSSNLINGRCRIVTVSLR